jgi:predicted MFS family arabinose efflux permease
MVPLAKQRLELDDSSLGIMLLLLGVGAIGAMPVAGCLVRRVGSRRLIMAAGGASCLLLPLLASASSALVLSLLLFLFGALTAVLNGSVNAQAVAIESASSSSLMSGFHCLFSLGGLLAVCLMSLFLKMRYPPALAAGVISAIGLLFFLMQGPKLLSFEEEGRPSRRNSGRLVFPDINLLLLGIVCFIAFMAEGSILDWSAEFLRSSCDYSPSAAGLGYGLFSLSMAFGRSIGDELIRRFSAGVVFQMGSFLAAVGFAVVVSIRVAYGEFVGFGLIGLGAANIVPILFSSAGRTLPSLPGTALTFVTTCGYIGGLLGPAFIGFLAQSTNLAFALGSLAFCLTAVGIGSRVIFSRPRREPAIG